MSPRHKKLNRQCEFGRKQYNFGTFEILLLDGSHATSSCQDVLKGGLVCNLNAPKIQRHDNKIMALIPTCDWSTMRGLGVLLHSRNKAANTTISSTAPTIKNQMHYRSAAPERSDTFDAADLFPPSKIQRNKRRLEANETKLKFIQLTPCVPHSYFLCVLLGMFYFRLCCLT